MHSDSHDASARFPKLNDSNYAFWSIMMNALLIRNKLWFGAVDVRTSKLASDGKPLPEAEYLAKYEAALLARDVEKMAESRAEMILRVEPGQLSHMLSEDPREIWRALKEVHQAEGFATTLALRRKFLTSKKSPMQSMTDWIGVIQTLAQQMRSANITVEEMDTILAITIGLPSSYEPIVISFDAMDEKDLTLRYVIKRLINDEFRQHSGITSPSKSPVKEEEEVGTMNSDSAMSVDHSNVKCYFCDKKGHIKQDCKRKKAFEAWESQQKGKERASAAAAHESDSEESSGNWSAC